MEFQIRGDMITLGQLLKAANVVSSGAEVKMMLSEGGVLVNGEADDRRGRKLRDGDVVGLPDGSTISIKGE